MALLRFFIWSAILKFTGRSLPSIAGSLHDRQRAPRERLSLDRGWLFHLGDIVQPPIIGHEESYGNAKANAGGAAGNEYDDSDWRRLDLPHDWAVEGPFDPKANVGAGLSSARHRLVSPLPEGRCGRSRQAF
jgi:hypothetical protein